MLVVILSSIIHAHGPDSGDFEELTLGTPNNIRTSAGLPGTEYWQQQADYEIHVTLDEDKRQISGSETIQYTNNSPDTLTFVWMQLDPNYLSNKSERSLIRTAPHMELENPNLDFEFLEIL